MTWPKIVLLVFYAVSGLLTISSIDKPRKPLSANAAMATVIVMGCLVALVVIA